MLDRETQQVRTVDGALLALRESLEHGLPDAASTASVRVSLRMLCLLARDEGVSPEQLLVKLKQTLDEVPGFDGRHTEAPRDGPRARVVSFMIDAYFSEPADCA